MAITEELFQELKDKVTDLNAINDTLYKSARPFIADQAARLDEYGTRIFMSPKQINWIRSLHNEFCGTADEAPVLPPGVDEQLRDHEDPAHGVRRDDDMEDEVPF
jgi:hypothetical protein